MSDLAVGLGLILMVGAVSAALLRSLQARRVTLLDWSLLGIGGIYGGGWILVILATRAGQNPSWAHFLLQMERLYALHTMCVLILVVGVYFGWLIAGRLTRAIPPAGWMPIPRANRRLSAAAWTLLLLAVLFQWAYTRAYGGFRGLLDFSVLIRAGTSDVSNPLSFLQPFGGLSFFASFVFFGLMLAGDRRVRTGIGMALAVAFSIYILVSWLGRMGFLMYATTFILAWLLARQVRPTILLLGGCIGLFLVLGIGYQISVMLNIKGADSFLEFLSRELSFPFVSFFMQLDDGRNLLRGFRDFVFAPLYLLPSSWWVGWIDAVGQVNTALIMGAPKGQQGVTGAIPVDLLTLGIMQAAAAGIVGAGLLFGAILRVAQRIVDCLPHPGVRSVFEAYLAIKIAVFAVFYAQPEQFVSGNFALLVAMSLLFAFLKCPRLRLLASSVRQVRTYGPQDGRVGL